MHYYSIVCCFGSRASVTPGRHPPSSVARGTARGSLRNGQAHGGLVYSTCFTQTGLCVARGSGVFCNRFRGRYATVVFAVSILNLPLARELARCPYIQYKHRAHAMLHVHRAAVRSLCAWPMNLQSRTVRFFGCSRLPHVLPQRGSMAAAASSDEHAQAAWLILSRDGDSLGRHVGSSERRMLRSRACMLSGSSGLESC